MLESAHERGLAYQKWRQTKEAGDAKKAMAVRFREAHKHWRAGLRLWKKNGKTGKRPQFQPPKANEAKERKKRAPRVWVAFVQGGAPGLGKRA